MAKKLAKTRKAKKKTHKARETGRGTARPLPTALIDPNAWMGAATPLAPVAPAGTQARVFDYPVSVNRDLNRQGEITFAQLRLLAQNDDLTRLLIETRKDQVKRQKWQFRVIAEDTKPKNVKTAEAKTKEDPRVKELEAFFRSPDGEKDFAEWIGELLEDVLVIDAASVLPRFYLDGKLAALDVIDGATIHRVITDEGKRPQPPESAYQQILRGVPAVNISAPYPDDPTVAQLVYKPRNPRAHKLYGFSPVEQIVMTVNIAIRRSIWQLSEFTEGNIPEAFIGMGDGANLTIEQINQFETKWNNIFAGDIGARRRAKFIPGKADNITFTKEREQKNDFDEWLFKIRAFAFSISPQAIVKQMNRASAEESVDASLSEGLAPILEYLQRFINYIVLTYWGFSDIEFTFNDDKEIAAKDQAAVDDLYIRNGTFSLDEVRDRLGYDPIDPSNPTPNLIYTKSGAVTIEQVLNPPEPVAPDDGSQPPTPGKKKSTNVGNKVEKKHAIVVSAKTITKKMRTNTPRLQRKIAKFFRKESTRIAEEVSKKYESIMKTGLPESQADQVLADLSLDSWVELRDSMTEVFRSIFEDGGKNALVDLDVNAEVAVFDLIDQAAVKYAEKRSAELVGMRIDGDGTLTTNPNPVYAITESTRRKLKSLVVDAITEGMTPSELADAIEQSTAFSADRAMTISRTELAKANVAGNLAGWRESGVVEGKEWLLGSEHGVEDECDDNADQGAIKLDEEFESGDDGPPAHPNCVCDVAASLTTEGDD